ncbi:MAG: hypothetical protein CL910_11500 [Deltaproteobacteria bacterium]|nr:hypothetical protein [Deltaproteobacteria bacterium]
MPRATSLAAALQETLGIDAILHEGDGGIYDVVADGELVYSKHDTGCFPEDQEIVDLLKPRLG